MAMSKELLDAQAKIEDLDTDLTLCGICKAPIEEPKALPCLHTFCLGCIKEWAEGKTGDKITCPLCKEDFVIPPEGVLGFRSNLSKTMKELASECRKVAEKVGDAIKIACDVENDLEEALQKAKQNVDQAMSEVTEHLKVKQQKCDDDITRAGDESRAKIAAEKDKLQSQQSQLRRALDMADTVTNRASPYDLAAIYTTLTDTMQKLRGIEPLIAPSELAAVKFLLNKDLQLLPELGTLTPPVDSALDLKGEWEMTSQMCTGKPRLRNAVSLALYPSGDFAVACITQECQVQVFNQVGTYKHSIDINGSRPCRVAISVNGNWYTCITDLTPVVKVFDMHATLISKFETIPPATIQSKKSSLCGLAVGWDSQIIVGDKDNSYISIHKLCGTHLSSFCTSIKPFFIAAAPNDNTIIISNSSALTVQILDYTGRVLHTLGTPWQPTGMCFNGGKEVLIASRAGKEEGKAGIHHYTTSGEYLGCITTEVYQPSDVAITHDGKILVLQIIDSVKVFTKK